MITRGYDDASQIIKNSNSTLAYKEAQALLAKELSVEEPELLPLNISKKVGQYKKLKKHTLTA